MIKKLLFASFLLVLMWVGCKKTEEMIIAPSGKTTLVLNLSGLQPLANNFSYEGWAIINSPVSTGKFNVNSSGALISTSGETIPNNEFKTSTDLTNASAIVITIEPANDTDPGPTATHYLAGNVSNGLAILTVGGSQALGNNFSTASGKYVLATPTDGMNNNEKSGIWFLDLSSGSPDTGLQLPVLPAGWKYEGWAVPSGKSPLTTGTFTNPAATDQAAPYSGTQPAPPFPGEDYISNAPSGFTFPLDLSGGLAVITIEPFPDDSPAPFTLKPLLGNIPTTAADHVTYSMPNQASTFPTGAAAIR